MLLRVLTHIDFSSKCGESQVELDITLILCFVSEWLSCYMHWLVM